MRPPSYQDRFATALLDRAASAPIGVIEPERFAIHRNNVHVSLIEALEERFPVTSAIVGADFFRGMARSFVRAFPPRSPLLMYYADELPAFIQDLASVRHLPYLADVARIEIACTEAFHAADAPVADPSELAALSPLDWETARLVLHPSVRTFSSHWPAASIWLAHQRGAGFGGLRWMAEDVLISRPGWLVGVHALPPRGAAFFTALADHGCLAVALSQLSGDANSDHRSQCLEVLFSGALTAVERIHPIWV